MAEGTPTNLWDIYTGPMPTYERGPAPPSNVIPPGLMQTEVQAGYPVVPGAGGAMRALQGLVQRPSSGSEPSAVVPVSPLLKNEARPKAAKELGERAEKVLRDIARVGQRDRKLKHGDDYDPEQPSRQGKVVIDPTSGSMGSAPVNRNVNYMGYTVWMKPGEFLGLSPSRVDSRGLAGLIKHVEQQSKALELQGGFKVAPPFLQVERQANHWEVTGHEGRGRAMALHILQPDVEIPINVFPNRLRARDLNEELVMLKIKPDSRAGQPGARPWSETAEKYGVQIKPMDVDPTKTSGAVLNKRLVRGPRATSQQPQGKLGTKFVDELVDMLNKKQGN